MIDSSNGVSIDRNRKEGALDTLLTALYVEFALTAAASRGVVVEMLDRHPMAWLDPLWERFHGLHRPPSAAADAAAAVLAELGLAPDVTRWERLDPPRQDPAWVARRLCLPEERVGEVAAALGTLTRPRTAATLTWRF